MATPIETVMITLSPRTRKGTSSAARMRSATSVASCRVGQVLEQDGELVAVQPSGGVAGSCRVAQPVGDLDQELVATGVAEPIVDLLEVVDVDVQDGQQLVAPSTRAARWRARRGPPAGAPLGRPVERVVEGAHSRLLVQPCVVEQDGGLGRQTSAPAPADARRSAR